MSKKTYGPGSVMPSSGGKPASTGKASAQKMGNNPMSAPKGSTKGTSQISAETESANAVPGPGTLKP